MGLFSRTPKVSLRAFCGDFYDANLFPAGIAGLDLSSTASEVIKSSIIEVEPKFSTVSIDLLTTEITCIRFEIFGLAWLHRLGDARTAELSVFTQEYIADMGRADMWDSMETYNQAIAQSSTLNHTFDTPKGRAYLGSRNTMLADFFDKWFAQDLDETAIARAANRLLTEAAWSEGRTAGYMALALCDRLTCQVNENALQRIGFIIRGFYDGVMGRLKAVKIES